MPPAPRTALPPEAAAPGPATPGPAAPGPAAPGPAAPGPAAPGRFRYDRGTATWTWSSELFAILGVDAATTEPGTEALVRCQHPDDRPRILDAFSAACAGRPFAIEVRVDGGRRAVVLIGEPELDRNGRVAAVKGIGADLTAGRPPGTDAARTRALATEVEQLRAAMVSRAVIEQAKGILMLLTSCRDQTAFDVLTHISSHTHRKIRDVARAITDSASGGARLPEDIRVILRDACPPAPHLP